MFDKLIDFIIQQINNLLPFCVIFEYEEGVRFRFGRAVKTLNSSNGLFRSGFHFKIPYGDEIMTGVCVETTLTLPAQSLTTLDGEPITVKGMVKYRIDDMKAHFTAVTDATDALSDISCGVVKKIIADKSWKDCQVNEIDNDITKKIRSQVKKYGIEIIQFTFTDIAKGKALRLFNENIPLS